VWVNLVSEIKPAATETIKNQILIQKQRIPNLLLVTRYMNPTLADDFARDDVEFLDTAGNVFLHRLDFYVYVKGNKPAAVPRDLAPVRPFQPKGLKVVFALLCDNDLLNRTYREIAELTGVALGTLAFVIKDLQLLGFLIRKKRGNVLTNKAGLLKRWVAEFNERLRPKQFIVRYRADQDWWVNAKLPPNIAWWGGEVAAARITEYLRPEFTTVYTTYDNVHDLAIRYRLGKDDQGNVEILEKFWTHTIKGFEKNVVHPILIYADLLARADKRNIETAKMIY